mmetsp:Transcript_37451/g.38132  ORF Transcript_37451/g.38132 Transcript_37451/m.38132 type:complete len:238 (+) Transcript_37451:84-797(+)
MDEGELLSCFTSEGLSLAFREINEIPLQILKSNLIQSCRRVDLTECGIKNLEGLKHFTSLESLVLDKNEIERLETLPKLNNLHTLWCNNNNISNLPLFLDDLILKCPRLQYLSLMRNPVCPVLMNLLHPDVEAIRLYRSYVIYRLPLLRMLDSEHISEMERQVARERGKYAVKRPLEKQSSDTNIITEKIEFYNVTEVISNTNYSDSQQGRIGKLKSKHKMDSKQSEGNRFIRDTHL